MKKNYQMKRGSEYGMCPVFKWGKCVKQILGVMKRAVKWTSTDNDKSTSVDKHWLSTTWKSAVWSTSTEKSAVLSTLTIDFDHHHQQVQPTGRPSSTFLRSTLTAAFFSVDSRQHFSSRPKFLVSYRQMGSIWIASKNQLRFRLQIKYFFILKIFNTTWHFL